MQVYHISDLMDGELGIYADAIVCVTKGNSYYPSSDGYIELPGNRPGYAYNRPFTFRIDGEYPPTVHKLRAAMPAPSYRGLPQIQDNPPRLSAESLAEQIKKRFPLTPEQLLDFPEFLREARRVAETGRTFSQDLLAWEKKAVVQAAVAIVRQQVDLERAEEAKRRARVESERKAREEAERPLKEAVLASYRRCKYRTCAQGHETQVEITDRAFVSSDVRKGERYSSSCTYPKMSSLHVLHVRADWLETVHARGLAVVYGQLTLTADLVGHTTNGEPVFACKTVKQSRGTSLAHETFHLARKVSGGWYVVEADKVTTYSDPGVARDALLDLGVEV